MVDRTFASNTEAFEYACEHLDCSLENGQPVLAVVLAVNGRMCSVKIANREDRSIPTGTVAELLAQPDLKYVCFSAMLADKVPQLKVGDLALFTTLPELAAAGKTTLAGTIVAKVTPQLTGKGTWVVYGSETSAPPQPAPAPATEEATAASGE
jgi:hypothetical protein